MARNINAWFVNSFLLSLEERMTNPKYPNQCIVSEKQALICERYMESKDCYDEYGRFTNYEIAVGTKTYLLTKRGKYYFLTMRDKSVEPELNEKAKKQIEKWKADGSWYEED